MGSILSIPDPNPLLLSDCETWCVVKAIMESQGMDFLSMTYFWCSHQNLDDK